MRRARLLGLAFLPLAAIGCQAGCPLTNGIEKHMEKEYVVTQDFANRISLYCENQRTLPGKARSAMEAAWGNERRARQGVPLSYEALRLAEKERNAALRAGARRAVNNEHRSRSEIPALLAAYAHEERTAYPTINDQGRFEGGRLPSTVSRYITKEGGEGNEFITPLRRYADAEKARRDAYDATWRRAYETERERRNEMRRDTKRMLYEQWGYLPHLKAAAYETTITGEPLIRQFPGEGE
ncbi:MAG: hypothetical protein N3A66_11065 [Planctomycetota bacterium]|nr:hypothetical protein [Planctomycetota bacterium]